MKPAAAAGNGAGEPAEPKPKAPRKKAVKKARARKVAPKPAGAPGTDAG